MRVLDKPTVMTVEQRVERLANYVIHLEEMYRVLFAQNAVLRAENRRLREQRIQMRLTDAKRRALRLVR